MVNSSPLEKAAQRLYEALLKYRFAIIASLSAGLMAYGFVFTNKLLNLDEVSGLFTKGETISSGRWALWLTSYIFPDVSMPWINGMLSLFMLSACVVLIVALFEIKKPLTQVLLACLFVVFPAQIVTFSYMFTCAPYALSLLMSVLSVFLSLRYGLWGFVAGAFLLAFSAGIYQAYIALSAALYLVYLIKRLLEEEWSSQAVFKKGLCALASLLVGLLIYALVNRVVMSATGTEYNSYASASLQTGAADILRGIRVAYTAFLGYFYKGYYHLAATPFSRLLHSVCALVIIAELGFCFFSMLKRGDRGRVALLALCLILLPLSINCLYVASAQRHTLMLYSFTAVYVLAAVLMERLSMPGPEIISRLLALAMALIICCNMVYANKLYMKMKLEYENAYGFYSGLVTRIKLCPGFDSASMVVISGDAHELIHHSDEIDTSDLVGIMEGLINVYSRNDFLTYYTGFCPPPIDGTDWESSGAPQVLREMPIYPYDGSVRKVGDYILVKLG